MTGFNPMPNPKLSNEYPEAFTSMGVTAENLAVKYSINRADQEEFAYMSYFRAESPSSSSPVDFSLALCYQRSALSTCLRQPVC